MPNLHLDSAKAGELMYATLVVVGGKADKRQLNIKLPTMLGRSRQADLTIAHSLISRKHCELREHEGVVQLTDLGSLNGTFCRDRKIQRVPLMPNDRFSVGPLTFEIRYDYRGDDKPAPHANAGAGASGLTIELRDPLELPPVELIEPVETSDPSPDRPESIVIQNAMAQQTNRLPGFPHPDCTPEPQEEENQCDRDNGQTIKIDSPDTPSHAVPLDAPTCQCTPPESNGQAKPNGPAENTIENEE